MSKENFADKEVNSRYDFLREKHSDTNPLANGYRFNSFFVREQKAVLSAIDKQKEPFLDLACGSGLMLRPLLDQGYDVFGLDYNEDACRSANKNGINVVRGDAFNIPIKDSMIGQIVNCQFLNQQPPQATKKFIQECSRVLMPGGQLIIFWRYANSLIHLFSHAVLSFKDVVVGQPPFPQYSHRLSEVKKYGECVGLVTVNSAVTLPFLKPDTIKSNNFFSRVFGASHILVMRKQ